MVAKPKLQSLNPKDVRDVLVRQDWGLVLPHYDPGSVFRDAFALIHQEELSPEAVGFEPRGGAAALWEAVKEHEEILLDGPAGTGKTVAILWWFHLTAHSYPGFRALFLRKRHVDLTASALQTFRERVLSRQSFGVTFYGGSSERPAAYQYPNGSEIIVGGLNEPTKVMSTDYDAAYINEALEVTEEDVENVSTRLRHGRLDFQPLVMDTNPGWPTHWLNKRCERGQTFRIWSRYQDNPRYWDADLDTWTAEGASYVVGKLDKLKGVRYQRLRLGKWVASEGQVLDAWDPAIHACSREWAMEQIAKGGRYFGTGDWGWTKPGVLQVWGIDSDGRLYRVHEVYRVQKPVESWWVPKAVELSKLYGFRHWSFDPSEPGNIAMMRDAGLDATGAENSIMGGLNAIFDRMAVQGDGRPRLYLCHDALEERDAILDDAKLPASTEEEIPEYIWPKGANGKSPKDLPVDDNNHGVDTMRYAVADVDLRKVTRAVTIEPVIGVTHFPALQDSGVRHKGSDPWGF